MHILEYSKSNILILDGAMGTLLQGKGLKTGEPPDIWNVTHPDIVREAHKAYLSAGADIILTNTFGANRKKLPSGYGVREVIGSALKLAKEAIQETGGRGYAVLDIGPIGELIEPNGKLTFGEAYNIFAEQVKCAYELGADAIYIETVASLQEARCAVLAAKENSRLPVFCTMTFERGGHTFLGTSLASAAITLDGLGADFLGINCSAGPTEVHDYFREMRKWTNKPLIVKPNAGIPVIKDGKTVFNVTAEAFASEMLGIIENGAGLGAVGGCCGTTPEFIKSIAPYVKGRSPLGGKEAKIHAVCSETRAVVTDMARIVGERINPTGKKKLQNALKNGDFDYIAGEAVKQVNAGAEILDVNIGMPGIDEERIMPLLIQKLQSVVTVPLQIDSSNFMAIEAGLRVYCGKAVVNSVNGDDETLDTVLPLVKKYGAMVIGLTLDKNGIPSSAKRRLYIAKKILGAAIYHGIDKNDVIIDCLTLTAGAEQDKVFETIRALELVKSELGVKTTLGISNISFGLPARDKLNLAFLTTALSRGLDFPIIDPNREEAVDAVFCSRLLKNNAGSGAAYLDRFSEINAQKKSESEIKAAKKEVAEKDIFYYVENGLKDEIRVFVKKLLESKKPFDIVSSDLIPALDAVGRNYETSKIFLPQLLASSEAAKSAFDVISEYLPPNEESDRPIILLATVEGDVHDIGKNIVKTVLENYGFYVIDMGCDVPAGKVADEAVSRGVGLVGLSALMTTTVRNMERTIREIKDRDKNIKVMVGGAVLTEEYALQIGADYYSKDALGAVRIAGEVFNR